MKADNRQLQTYFCPPSCLGSAGGSGAPSTDFILPAEVEAAGEQGHRVGRGGEEWTGRRGQSVLAGINIPPFTGRAVLSCGFSSHWPLSLSQTETWRGKALTVSVWATQASPRRAGGGGVSQELPGSREALSTTIPESFSSVELRAPSHILQTTSQKWGASLAASRQGRQRHWHWI